MALRARPLHSFRARTMNALAQPVQQHVDGGGGEQGHELAGEQAADDGHAQGLAQFGPLAKDNGQRQRAQAGGQRGHEDGAQALEAGFAHGAARVQAPLAFGAQGKVDDEDGSRTGCPARGR